MANAVPIDWSKGEQSGLVDIGTHKLCLYSHGPDRKPGEPVVICITGLASSCKASAAVTRLLKPHIRSYTYDRSGFGGSELCRRIPNSTNIALELDLLLKNAPIAPPYIFIAHSYGGILVREFLHLQPNPTSIASLVLLGANHDHMAKLIDWRHPAIWSMAANLDFSTLPSFTDPHTLTPEEWDIYQADIASTKHMAQADLERPHYTAAFETIEAKGHMQRAEKGEPPLLGDSPVAAQSKGFQEIYDAGLKAGNGSPEEQATFGKMVATWKETHERLQNELQALSSCTKVRYLACQHNVHEDDPQSVVEEVLWVLKARKEGKGSA
ncbi:Alpha/Beta hydrolase protein [Hyaloscypha finlandica]|nr:Alpha/Beta hydrolase protein [Hyaloscypha finlandica]